MRQHVNNHKSFDIFLTSRSWKPSIISR